jgi:aspartate racemase
MRTVGIIGGLGPETTSKFYLEVVFSCFEKDKVNRPPMLIWNIPLPYCIEEKFIMQAEGEAEYLPFLIDAAKRLEKGGADFIVIPCNSVHVLIDEVRKSVNIPILSIVEETVRHLVENDVREVGLLATSATIRKQLYEEKLLEKGIVVNVPADSDQNKMGQIINNLVHSRQDEIDKQELLSITRKMIHEGNRTILLACTDLQLITPTVQGIKIIDTMNILVHATVREILTK